MIVDGRGLDKAHKCRKRRQRSSKKRKGKGGNGCEQGKVKEREQAEELQCFNFIQYFQTHFGI